jgi:hypothetical protein
VTEWRDIGMMVSLGAGKRVKIFSGPVIDHESVLRFGHTVDSHNQYIRIITARG